MRVKIRHLRSDFTPGHFLNEHRRAFERVEFGVGVGAPLKAETGVGFQPVALGGAADHLRRKVGAFEVHARGFGLYAGGFSAENSPDAHWGFGVANHQVAGRKFALHAVERRKQRAFGGVPDDDLLPFDGPPVVGVERLTQFVIDEIGHVDDVIDGIEANGPQAFLQPLRRRADFDAVDRHAAKTGAGSGVLNGYLNRKVVAVDPEGIDSRQVHVPAQEGFEVAGHAHVRGGVGAVGRQADFQTKVGFETKVFGRRGAVDQIGVQNQNARVTGSQPKFVFSANHAFGNGPPDFRFFYNKRFRGRSCGTRRVEFSPHGGHHDFLSGGHVRRAAHDR